jgi:hypothetical protein
MKGLEIEKVTYTRAALMVHVERKNHFALRGVSVEGRVAVIVSRGDISTSLLGYSFYGCAGFRPATAYEIMRNIVLYASGAKEKP